MATTLSAREDKIYWRLENKHQTCENFSEWRTLFAHQKLSCEKFQAT